MSSPSVPKRFALLVRMNFYLDNQTRQLQNSKSVSLTHLEGAVNNVKAIEKLLQNRFQFNSISIFTSSASPTDPSVPSEPQYNRPTHANIKRKFENIHNAANPKDIFFFHFSRYGAPLETTPEVRVIVLLDSCYSVVAGKAKYRFRSPDNWALPPNLPADEAAVQGTLRKPGHRNGYQIFWDLNPKNFTVIAACQSTEVAAKKSENGLVYNAFTLAFIKYFHDAPDQLSSTYHAICDHTAKLAFLEDYEPIPITPNFGQLQRSIISLPVGTIHSIIKGAEFTTNFRESKVIVSISEARDLKSTARIITDPVPSLPQSISFIPYRWSSEKTLNIIVDPKIGHRITGSIQCTEVIESTREDRISDDPKVTRFQLRLKENGDIEIFGSKQLLGGQGPVCGWKTRGTDDEMARESAIALAHLFRFGQIFHLRNEFEDTAPFQVTIKPTGIDDREFQFKLRNNGAEELYFAVLILSPGFHVKQVFPSDDTTRKVPPHGESYFKFRLGIPDKLRLEAANGQQHKHRDIIRTVLIRGKAFSLKSMELPDIWEADQWENRRLGSSVKHGEPLKECS
ncbi:caspase domain-containing protein [Xylaria digitata]|nr:caspase domain-containing protein [Xylaria digitata]